MLVLVPRRTTTLDISRSSVDLNSILAQNCHQQIHKPFQYFQEFSPEPRGLGAGAPKKAIDVFEILLDSEQEWQKRQMERKE